MDTETDPQTVTLTDFLLARIAEDEAIAEAAVPGPWQWDDSPADGFTIGQGSLRSLGRMMTRVDGVLTDYPETVLSAWGYDASELLGEPADKAHIARHDPARVLAECKAKRAIVSSESPWSGDEFVDGYNAALDDIHELLAAVYADHPDYREDGWEVTL